MAKKSLSNWRKVNKKTKSKFLISLILTILFFVLMIGMVTALMFMFDECKERIDQDVASNAAWLTEKYKSFNDAILNANAPTYNDLLIEKGPEGFTWFMLTSCNSLSLIPYIMIPISVIGLLTSFGFAIMRYRAIFPPKQKSKKAKRAKKGGK